MNSTGGGMTTGGSGGSNGQYHEVSTLSTPLPPPTSSIALQASSSTSSTVAWYPPESKWWERHYGLSDTAATTVSDDEDPTAEQESSSKKPPKRKQPICLHVPTKDRRNNISDIHIGPDNKSIAVCAGPRVLLYSLSSTTGTSSSSVIHTLLRALNTGNDPEEVLNINNVNNKVQPDRSLPASSPVTCVRYRPDGRVIAYGGSDGTIRIVDTHSRSILRTYGGTRAGSTGSNNQYGSITGATRAMVWLRDGKHLVTAGDDACIRIWNIRSNSRDGPVVVLRGHGDGIRCLSVFRVFPHQGGGGGGGEGRGNNKRRRRVIGGGGMQSPPPTRRGGGHHQEQEGGGGSSSSRQVLISGGYDHTVRVWDLNALKLDEETEGLDDDSGGTDDASDRCLLSLLHHGHPVESLLHVPPGSTTPTTTTTVVPPEEDDDDDDDEDEEEGGEEERRRRQRRRRHQQVLVASAGGTCIKLWDITTGTALATQDGGHSKTITAICLSGDRCGADLEVASLSSTTTAAAAQQKKRNVDGDNDEEQKQLTTTSAAKKKGGRRLISVGLDGHVRIYSLPNLRILHGYQNPSPLLSLTMMETATMSTTSSPSSSASPIIASSAGSTTRGGLLITGSSDGMITFRRPSKPSIPPPKRDPKPGTYAFFMRTGLATPEPDDYKVVIDQRKRIKMYDKLLRSFRYGDALDEALSTKNAQNVASVLEELSRRRKGLDIALSNRDEEALEPLLSFVVRFVAQPRYSPLLIGVATTLCDIYGPLVGQGHSSAVVDELFDKLRRHVSNEVRVQQNMLKLTGQIDSILCMAEML